MNAEKLNVRVVRTPFAALGLQPMVPYADTQSPIFVDAKRHRDKKLADGGNHVFVGARGLMKLRADAKKAAGGAPTTAAEDATSAAGEGGCDDSAGFARCASLQLLSRHSKATLLLHDAETGNVGGVLTHEGARNAGVAQVVVTPQYIFTRLEDAPTRNDDNPLQADCDVYAWGISQGNPQQREHVVLHHHRGRVVAIAAHPKLASVIASAALDALLCLWDLSVSTSKPVFESQIASLGVVSSLLWHHNVLVAASSDVPVSVWRYADATLTLVAEAPANKETSVTSLSLGRGPTTAHEADTLPDVYLGYTNGWVACWSPATRSRDAVLPLGYRNSFSAQAHAGAVSLLAVAHDNAVVISGSLSGGVHFLHVATGGRALACVPPPPPPCGPASTNGSGNRTGSGGGGGDGVTALLVDTANCTALVGTTSGHVACFDYSAFAAMQGGSLTVAVPCVWSLRPHTASITGLVVELSAGNVWGRVTTSCVDGSFTSLTCASDTSGKRSFAYLPANGPVPLSEINFFKRASTAAFPGEDPAALTAIETDCIVGQDGIDRAFARAESSVVDLVGSHDDGAGTEGSGGVAYRITRDGSVLSAADKQAELTAATPSRHPRPPKHISYTTTTATPATASTRCLALTFDDTSRILSILYADGLLQMVDLSSLFVAARYWLTGDVVGILAHSGGVEVEEKDKTTKKRIPYPRCVPAFN